MTPSRPAARRVLGRLALTASVAVAVPTLALAQVALAGSDTGDAARAAHASAHASTHGSHSSTKPKADKTTKGSDHSHGNAGTSGDASQPQPPSNADQNGGGANGDQCSSDPKATYCSTRDGSPSLNGNGGGNATGKPCAGCVGKADNKNPPGQEMQDPMGTFPNNGYECDHNNGIGKTNPAHTGCQSTTTPGCDEATEDCTPNECDEATEDCTPSECDEATEDCTPNETCTATAANNFCSEVLGEHHNRKPPVVLGERIVAPEADVPPTAATPGALPFTGGEIGILLMLAVTALGAGGAILLVGRRRRSAQI
jgi:hypothetical protein